jgi:hypothetical protein
MLEAKSRLCQHLRGLAEFGDDRVLRTVYGENAKAGNRSDQTYRCHGEESAPIRPIAEGFMKESSHDRSAALSQKRSD